MVDQNLRCPRCGQIDMIQKVSAIYSAGIMSSTSSGTGGGLALPLGSGKPSVVGGIAQFDTKSQTGISSLLAPPGKPTKRGNAVQIITMIIGGIMLFILAGCGSSLLFFNFLRSEVYPFISCLFPSAIVLILLIVGFKQIQSGSKKEDERISRASQKWERAIVKWNELYYCARDDGVFNPAESIFIPLEQMRGYLYE